MTLLLIEQLVWVHPLCGLHSFKLGNMQKSYKNALNHTKSVTVLYLCSTCNCAPNLFLSKLKSRYF